MAKHHLTDRFIENITPRGTPRFRPDAWGRIEIGDVRVEGLVLRISQHGLKTWSFLYRPTIQKANGRYSAGPQRRLTMGPYPQISLKAARERALEARELLLAGIDPMEKEPKVSTFKEVCFQYIEKSLEGRVKDAPVIRQRMQKHVLPRWGNRPVTDITRGDVHELLDIVKESGPGAARNIRRHLHAMFNWAVDREIVAVNPLYRLRRDDLAPPKDARTPLTDNQIRDLWHLPLRIAPQLKLLLLTGCRKVEIGCSHWDQYDIPNRTFTIPAARQKSGREIVVPLSKPALDVLAEIPRKGPEVFGVRGYLTGQQLKAAQKRLTWRLRPHDLRSTAATRMAQLRIAPNIISLCLGHGMKGVLPVYSKYDYLEEKREAFERYGAHILEVINGQG